MDLVMAIVVLLLSIVCAVISVLQFKEKGVLLNNAYIYASKQERENMDKTPHYRQSGIVFALISAIFFDIAGRMYSENRVALVDRKCAGCGCACLCSRFFS